MTSLGSKADYLHDLQLGKLVVRIGHLRHQIDAAYTLRLSDLVKVVLVKVEVELQQGLEVVEIG